MAVVYDNCCICIGLRVGSLIIAYLTLAQYILSMVVIAFDENTERLIEIIEGKRAVEAEPIIFFTLSIPLMIIGTVFTILLLVGLHQDKRGFVKPFIIYETVCLVIGFFLYSVAMSVNGIAGKTLAGDIFLFLLEIYLLLVIRSHYLKMGSAANEQMVSDFSTPKKQCIAYKV